MFEFFRVYQDFVLNEHCVNFSDLLDKIVKSKRLIKNMVKSGVDLYQLGGRARTDISHFELDADELE